MKISAGGGMKKELFHYHYEKVIDKPYNERQKVKFPNIFVALGLSFISSILAVGIWLFGDGNFLALGVLLYMNFMTCIMLTHTVQEAILNKRVFAFPIIFDIVMLVVTGGIWLVFINPFSNFSVVSFIAIAVVLFITVVVFGIYILVAWLLSIRKERGDCKLKVRAVCIGFSAECVDRFVDNFGYSRYERAVSVAYGESEQVMVYTPIFKFILNGIEYKVQSNFKSNVKKFTEGKVYDIYVNPSNPTECRV